MKGGVRKELSGFLSTISPQKMWMFLAEPNKRPKEEDEEQKMLRGKLFLISVAVLFQAVSISFGDLLLDQAQESPWNVGTSLYSWYWEWQEFRPTMNNLEQVDFLLEKYDVPEGEVVFFEVKNDNDTTLWSTSFSADILPNFGWFALDTPQISLVPEETYRLYLSSSLSLDEGFITWYATEGDPYDRGSSSWWDPAAGVDYAFRTWAVPEPTTLLILGLGGLGLIRKRRT